MTTTPADEAARTGLTVTVLPHEVLLLSGEAGEASVLTSSPRQSSAPPFGLVETGRSLQRAQAAIRGLGPTPERLRRAEHTLESLGRLLGRVLTRRVTDRLAAEAARAGACGEPLLVALAIDDPDLHDFPWEATILPGTTTPLALHSDIVPYRVQRAESGRSGPTTRNEGSVVHLLAALADPVPVPSGGASHRLLDLENETRRLALAVSTVPGRVRLSLLGSATVSGFREMLAERPADIVHIACHAVPGALLLEDETGESVNVTAAELASVFASTRVPELLFLAGCSTAERSPLPAASAGGGEASGTGRLPGVAEEMASTGLPVVVAMSGPVSDDYAGRLASGTYSRVAGGEDALTALHRTRTELENARRRSGSQDAAEWYLPVVIAAEPTPHARSEPLPPAVASPVDRTTRPHPQPGALAVPLALPLGQFVGRRAELRSAQRGLVGDGHRGIVVHGIGGGGKSAFAGELLRRLAGGRPTAVLSGVVEPRQILLETARVLASQNHRCAPELDARLAAHGAGWRECLDVLKGDERFVVRLVLDDFEQNLVGEPNDRARPRSAELARFLSAWITGLPLSKVLFTSRRRFRLPDRGEELLGEMALPPLSEAETDLLRARMPTVGKLDANTWAKARRAIGGHPRTYAFLEALLRSADDTPVPGDVLARLRELTETDVTVLRRRVGGRVRLALSEAVRLSMADTLLRELLSGLGEAESRLLHRLAVHRRPVSAQALNDSSAPSATRSGLELLLDRGLAVRLSGSDGELWLMDRWTAEAVERTNPAPDTSAHAAAAEYWSHRFEEDAPVAERLAFAEEAMFHFNAAGDGDAAFRTGSMVCGRLHEAGRWADEARVCRRMFDWAEPGGVNETMIHRQLGLIERDQGNVRDARRHLRHALSLSTLAGNALDAAFAEHQLGSIAHEGGELEEAAARYRTARAVFQEAGRPWEAAASLYQLSMVDEDLGHLAQARQDLLEAMSVFEEHEGEDGLAECHLRLGTLSELEGEFAAAEERYAKAVEINRRTRNWAGHMTAKSALGTLYLRLGNYENSYRELDAVLTEATRQGEGTLLASALHNMGAYAQHRNDLVLAEGYFLQALETNERIGRLPP
ncbi:CHAT domain-containing protein [Nocardiopsis dassonvillei]|uniref:CHAT domain-containing tetratricopeptide repeat protein n=1 Tax=Nocardiopsis dassonvillei TaxID=2014 RepID=UPI0033EBA231